MKCDKCSAIMKVSRGTPTRPSEYLCLQCGFKKSVREEDSPSSERTRPQLQPSQNNISITSSKKKTSTQVKKKNLEGAKRLSELRQVSKELITRIADLEIQLGRRMEELQRSAVELQRIVESYHE